MSALALVGFATSIWVIAAAVFVVGICFSAPMVIWGTLLQRRVPPHMLGRVSSLDFFVSLAFMPVSMAIAGPVSESIGLGTTFVLAGVLPTVIAILAIVLAKMPKDELDHPLDILPEGDAAPPADDSQTASTEPPHETDLPTPIGTGPGPIGPGPSPDGHGPGLGGPGPDLPATDRPTPARSS